MTNTFSLDLLLETKRISKIIINLYILCHGQNHYNYNEIYDPISIYVYMYIYIYHNKA